MKTWEMIKELTENPEKKFKRVGDELEVSLDSDNSLLWKSGHAPFNINHVWKEVKEPVDFMTAFKAWYDDKKTIIVETEFKGEVIMASIFEGCNEYAEFGAGLIAEGKWYIED